MGMLQQPSLVETNPDPKPFLIRRPDSRTTTELARRQSTISGSFLISRGEQNASIVDRVAALDCRADYPLSGASSCRCQQRRFIQADHFESHRGSACETEAHRRAAAWFESPRDGRSFGRWTGSAIAHRGLHADRTDLPENQSEEGN